MFQIVLGILTGAFLSQSRLQRYEMKLYEALAMKATKEALTSKKSEQDLLMQAEEHFRSQLEDGEFLVAACPSKKEAYYALTNKRVFIEKAKGKMKSVSLDAITDAKYRSSFGKKTFDDMYCHSVILYADNKSYRLRRTCVQFIPFCTKLKIRTGAH